MKLLVLFLTVFSDFYSALQAALAKEGGLGEEGANSRLTALAQKEHRYVRDIWS